MTTASFGDAVPSRQFRQRHAMQAIGLVDSILCLRRKTVSRLPFYPNHLEILPSIEVLCAYVPFALCPNMAFSLRITLQAWNDEQLCLESCYPTCLLVIRSNAHNTENRRSCALAIDRMASASHLDLMLDLPMCLRNLPSKLSEMHC